MEGSFSSASTYEEWEAKRHFITDMIDDSGSILDVGCGNGFLLRSLQEWSPCTLVPYGIDIRDDLIAQAKALFPEEPANFHALDVKHIDHLADVGLPTEYHYVFWNFLGQWRIEDDAWQSVGHQVVRLGTRRTIIGFYGTNQYRPYSEEWQRERERLLQLPTRFREAGFSISGHRVNPTSYNQVIAWIDHC